ncbi:MAG TPA: M4 family metallopeptidase [Croceibacterium sp.]|nr:M4 family metallopeptidase [Croceibacterium sp.]
MPAFKTIDFAIGDEVHDGDQTRLRRLRAGAILDRVGPAGLARALPGLDLPGRFHETAREHAQAVSRQNDEAATRLHLQTYLEDAGDRWMAEITSPARAELVPDMRLQAVTEAPAIGARSAVYQQSAHGIPIFGTRIVVDIDAADKSLLAINGKVGPAPDKPPLPELSPKAALESLLEWSRCSAEVAARVRAASPAAALEWHLDERGGGAWHLAYHFRSLPLSPRPEPATVDERCSEVVPACVGLSPHCQDVLCDYFVDAHDGEVVFWFGSAPCADIAVAMTGVDTSNTPRTFLGRQDPGPLFAMADPLHNLETYDYAGGDLAHVPPPPLPAGPVTSPSAAMGNAHPGAVSAHHHARVVTDFFRQVLNRNGIDDKGMKLVSVVNAFSSRNNSRPAPNWANAVWHDNKMWYGNVGGKSYAQFLDVTAHEIAHGVTASEANLVYQWVYGALNESFSDFFGIVIANWHPGQPNALANWNWEIGSGLGKNGGPIRDFSNPAKTGQPVEWPKFVELPWDEQHDFGGVHTNSGIHNKVLFHLLTDTDAAGALLIPTVEVVRLVYHALQRLTPTSDFKDSKRALGNAAKAFHAGDQATINARLAAIAGAFATVGL